MRDPDATAPVPRPTPAPGGGMTDSAVGALFDAASPAFATQRTSPSRGWEPPSVEDLQRLLPQYEISAFLARGGMGAVYKGMQRTLKRAVAIKVLPPDMGEDDGLQFAERFKREAQAMARLSHPNIVAVFEAGEVGLGGQRSEVGGPGAETQEPTAGDPTLPPTPALPRKAGLEQGGTGGTLLYFVMEFIEGTDVAQLIASEGIIEPLRAIQITTAVCEALAFAHEEGIVHRDIKPSNVMIDRRGRVKVADFGLAKTVSAESTMLTRSDVAMGTPDFVAPEALIPGIAVDGRADIYAVGVMLYQMLTGKIPRGRFALPSGVVPKVDKRFDAIVDKAMQTDRDQRYSTASEMKKDMEKVATRLAPSTKTEAADGASSRSSAKRSLILGIAAIAVVSIAAAWYALNQEPEAAPSSALSTDAAAASVSQAAPQKAAEPSKATTDWAPLPAAVEARGIKLWDSPDKLPKARGITWEDQALRLEQAAAWHDATESRDAILRASVLANPGGSAVIALRSVSGNPDHVRLALDAEKQSLALRTSNADRPLGEWPLPRKYTPDEWLPLELRTIGEEFSVFVGGKLIGTARSAALNRPGRAMLYAGNGGYFRDITYYPLDGLPEAEASRLAGASAPSAPWQPAFGKPLEQLVTKDGSRTYQDGWLTFHDGLPPAKVDFARGMARVRIGWLEQTSTVKLAINDTRIELSLGANGIALHRWAGTGYAPDAPSMKLPVPLASGAEIELRVAWINGRIYGWAGGSEVGSQTLLPGNDRISNLALFNEKAVQQVRIREFEILNLDGLPEAEALKLVRVSDAGDSPSAYRFPDGPPGFVKELTGHKGEVRSMVILPDNRSVISIADKGPAGDDVNELVLSDVETAQPLWSRQLKEIKGVLGGMAILPAVNQAVVIHRGPEFVMEFLDLDKGTTLRQVKVEKPQEGSFGTQLVAAPDGRRFMLVLFPAQAGTSDAVLLQLWDSSGDAPLGTWKGPGRCDGFHTAAWLDAGRFVTSFQDVANDRKVHLLLETAGAGGLHEILGNERDVGFFFTPVPGQPDQILTHWQSRDLALCDVAKSTMLRKFGVSRFQRQLVFVDPQRVLGLSTEFGDALRLWDVRGGKLLWEQKDERLRDAVAVSPDGRFAVTNCSTKNAAGENRPGNKLLVWRLPKAEGEPAGDAATFGGHRYRVVKEQLPWLEAKAKAEAMGGHLATLTSKEEADFVAGLCRQVLPNKPGQAWLGGVREKGKDTPWTWITGEPFGYSNWRSDHVYEDDQPYSMTFQPGDGRKGVPESWNNWKQSWDLQRIRDHIGGYVVEWEEAATFGGHRYQFVPFMGSWTQAKAKAKAMGGHLATITSAEEHAWFLNNIAKYSEHVWLGGYKTPTNQWAWVTGEPWKFTAWARHTDGVMEPMTSGKSPETSNETVLEFGWYGPFEKPGGWNDQADIERHPAESDSGFLVEWDDTVTFNGHRYQFIPGALSWADAKAKAEQMGGHLATVTSQEEHAWIIATFGTKIQKENEGFHIGGQLDGAEWKWVTGEPFTFTGWLPGFPNGNGESHFLQYMRRASGVGWDDRIDNTQTPPVGFLVEWDAPAKSL